MTYLWQITIVGGELVLRIDYVKLIYFDLLKEIGSQGMDGVHLNYKGKMKLAHKQLLLIMPNG